MAQPTPTKEVSVKDAQAAQYVSTCFTHTHCGNSPLNVELNKVEHHLRGGIQWGKPISKVARPKSARKADLEVHLDDVLFAEDTTIFTTVEKHEADEAGLRQVLSSWGEDMRADKTERIPLGTGAKEPFMCRWLESPAGLLAAPKFFLLAEHFCRIGSLLCCQKIQTKQHLVMALWFLGPVSPIKNSTWPGIRSVPSCITMWVKAWKKASSPKLEKILLPWRKTMKRRGWKCVCLDGTFCDLCFCERLCL